MLWLYALTTASGDGKALTGASGEPVAAWQVAADGAGAPEVPALFALAGEVDAPLALGEATLRAHDRAVRALAAAFDPLLPVRFGQTVAGAGELAALLAPSRASLVAALAAVAGCEQFTLRFRRPPGGADVAPGGAPGIDEEHAVTGPGTRYLRARARAAAVEPPAAAAALLGRLAPHRRAERLAAAPPPFAVAAYHLVERVRRDAYLAALGEAAAGEPALVAWSGPWPPWAFAPRELG